MADVEAPREDVPSDGKDAAVFEFGFGLDH